MSQEFKQVGHSIPKMDSEAIIQGKPIYTADLVSPDALIVRIIRSPHAHALVVSVDKEAALAVPGVVGIYTHEDVPKTRFTLAGQSFPEPSHYDRLILDQRVRYVGDEVVIVAAETAQAADEACRLVKVKYEVLPAVVDFEKALDNEVRVHHAEDLKFNIPAAVGGQDVDRNLMGSREHCFGEPMDEVLARCPLVIDRTYYTPAQSQAMMETFRSYTYLDNRNRLTVITSTQVPFHIKRQLAIALEMAPARIHVIKPRVGGGFGAKQTSVTEIFPAFVTMKTGRPAYLEYTRKESFIASNSRHAMRVRVQIGAQLDGTMEAINIEALSDQGAYSVHGWTTLGLVGEKTLPMYGRLKAARYFGQVVYTNKMPAGAFRGYGATQGCFAVESAINELAHELKMDPVALRLKNVTLEGETTTAYGKTLKSVGITRCLERGKEMIGWQEGALVTKVGRDVVRAKGMAVTLQGSGIMVIDTSTVHVHLNETGDYTLLMSPTDVGTGTDTVVTQMVAEVLSTTIDNINVITADTDITPYDPGSYASSGVYITGMAAVNAARDLVGKMLKEAGRLSEKPLSELGIIDDCVVSADNSFSMSVHDLAEKLSAGLGSQTLMGSGSYSSPVSPPPFMAGFVEIELDLRTCKVKPIRTVGVVDCGKVINPALARIQAEGGIVQGMGFAITEDIHLTEKGGRANSSFLYYRIPCRCDVGEIEVDFVETHEPTGPFGAKSIGEVVINTTAPAIADAVFRACGARIRSLPVSAEKIFQGMRALTEEKAAE